MAVSGNACLSMNGWGAVDEWVSQAATSKVKLLHVRWLPFPKAFDPVAMHRLLVAVDAKVRTNPMTQIRV